ncbi:hypothetical protein OIE66_17700 [Nonomuraea sp. NBC_01738]|uniref:hypothetical protein n=1 Tax=Nonomuraea sp. NBC_01738 TaxID=2976003 RepID=UPI002E11E8D8|nr:hypothetical protein OIE66_17700 [Nonomuraea sp. NBC_01738]
MTALITAHKRPVMIGVTGGGLVVAGGLVVTAALANMANPEQYFDDRDTWNTMLTDLKLSAWDVWISYFAEVSPYWNGHASETVQRYLRFQLIGMFDELGRVDAEIGNVLTDLGWEIADYDTKVVELFFKSSTVFTVLLPFGRHPLGRLALGAAAIAFIGYFIDVLQEFLSKIKGLDKNLLGLRHKINELNGLFSVGDGKLHLQAPGKDLNLWVPVTKEHP